MPTGRTSPQRSFSISSSVPFRDIVAKNVGGAPQTVAAAHFKVFGLVHRWSSGPAEEDLSGICRRREPQEQKFPARHVMQTFEFEVGEGEGLVKGATAEAVPISEIAGLGFLPL